MSNFWGAYQARVSPLPRETRNSRAFPKKARQKLQKTGVYYGLSLAEISCVCKSFCVAFHEKRPAAIKGFAFKIHKLFEKSLAKTSDKGTARAFPIQKLLRRFSRGKRPAAIKGFAFKIHEPLKRLDPNF